MSLQVWLPLNGDLHNQGLNGDLEFSAINTLTFNNDGKIGKSYQRATNNTQVTTGININSNLLDLLGTEASVAVWVKPLGTHTHYNGTLLSSGNWNAKRWAFGVSQDNTKVDVLCGGYNTYIDCTVPVNEWTHLCSTFDNGISKLYKNGVYIGQLTGRANFDSDAANTCIGRETYASGYFGFNGLINDMRIYNHALSDKEVEEIAKGLVLHYKLNDIKQDYSTNLVTSLTAGGQTTVANNIITTSGTNADTYFTINLSENIVEGTSYIISCDAEIPEGKCWTFPLGWQGNTSLSFQIYNGHNVYAFTANSGSWGTKRIFMDDGGSPNSVRSTGAQTKIFNFCVTKSGIISDSSGYNNNGELYGYDTKGLITIVSDSPRYNVSTFINSANNTTNTASGTRYIYCHCALTNPATMSVAFWCKPIAGYGGNTGQGQFCTTTYEFGNTNVGSDYQASAMNHRDNAVDMNDSASTTQCRPTFLPTANEWHHYVITYDGQNGKVYKDGVQSSIASFSAVKTLDSFIGIVIGFSKAGGVWRSNQSYFSDFRIYVTALTAEQVLDLYHTSASIDKEGNVYARELVEE